MKHLWLFGVIGFSVLLFQCKNEAQQIEPAAQGQRGEACQARNDCQSGLACILGLCSKNDFELTSSALHCDRVDCQTDGDCCGNKPSEAPAKCDHRISVCQTPTLAGCVQTSCTSSASCGSGTCPSGYCSNSTNAACTGSGDCTDTCNLDTGLCTLSGYSCTSDISCTGTGLCSTRYCSCTNPEYLPSSAICTDPECLNVCTLRCSDERCIADTACTTDTDCTTAAHPVCSSGNCVECTINAQCDVLEGEECRKNVCKKPCVANEECPLFNGCKEGDCVPTGCQSDRECVLAANANNPQVQSQSVEDARLSKCLPSDADSTIKTCKIPCENDGACGSEFQICDAGFCRFIGCETDDECRAYLGIVNETETDAKPFISHAVCRE
jgi:hypothetical protein